MDNKKLAALIATVAAGASLAVFSSGAEHTEVQPEPVHVAADAAADGPIDLPLDQIQFTK